MGDEARTVHAQQAFKLADLFTYRFAHQTFGERRAYKLRLNEPDGVSTDGGRKARQSIVLVPETGERGEMVCGWIDVAAGTGELRSFRYLSDQHKQRFGKKIDLEREVYERLLETIREFLEANRLSVDVVDSPGVAAPSPVAVTAKGFVWTTPGVLGVMMMALAVGVLLGFGLGFVAFAS